MRAAETRVREEGKLLRDGAEPLVAADALTIEPKVGAPARVHNMVIPVAAVIIALPVPAAKVLRWVLGAVLRGRVGLVSQFLAQGKRVSQVKRELAFRKKLLEESSHASAP